MGQLWLYLLPPPLPLHQQTITVTTLSTTSSLSAGWINHSKNLCMHLYSWINRDKDRISNHPKALSIQRPLYHGASLALELPLSRNLLYPWVSLSMIIDLPLFRIFLYPWVFLTQELSFMYFGVSFRQMLLILQDLALSSTLFYLGYFFNQELTLSWSSFTTELPLSRIFLNFWGEEKVKMGTHSGEKKGKF